MARAKPESAAPPPNSPYLNARNEWNERYGSYIKAAHHWRLTAFGAIGLAAIAVTGNIWQSAQSRIMPYVVEVDGHGDPLRVSPADMMHQPDTNEIRASIRRWLIGARTLYSDPHALRAAIEQTYALTASGSAAFKALSKYDSRNNPFQAAATRTVTVQVNAIVPVSDESWHVEWTEKARRSSGDVTSTEWQGTVTVKIAAPTTEAALMVNPIGVYVTDYAWTERLTG